MARKSISEQLSIEAERIALQADEKTIRDCDELLAGSTLNGELRLRAIEMRDAAGARPEIRKQRRLKDERDAADHTKFTQMQRAIDDLKNGLIDKETEKTDLVQKLISCEKNCAEIKTRQDVLADLSEHRLNLLLSVLAFLRSHCMDCITPGRW